MPATVTYAVDERSLRNLERLLSGIRRGVPRATSAAINRTLTTGRAGISKRIGSEIALKAGDIKARITLKRASVGRPVGRIRITRKAVPLALYKPSQTGPGVTVKVRKAEARQLLRSAFLHTSAGGQFNVVERRLTGGAGGARVRRLPIVARYGPTVLGVFEGLPGLEKDQLGRLDEVLAKNVRSQVDRLLAGR